MQSIKIGREGGRGGWKSKWQKAGGGGGGGGWMWSRLSDCQMANIDNSCPPPLPLYILLAGVRPGWRAMLRNSYSLTFSNKQMFFPEMNVSFTWRWQQEPQIEMSATFSWNWYPTGSTQTKFRQYLVETHSTSPIYCLYTKWEKQKCCGQGKSPGVWSKVVSEASKDKRKAQVWTKRRPN